MWACGSTFAIVPLQLCLSVYVCMCAYVCVFIRVCACFLPALTVHHGSPAEHCCISASLGLSPRSSERLDPAGNRLGPEDRENGERIGMEEEVKHDNSVLRKI